MFVFRLKRSVIFGKARLKYLPMSFMLMIA
jgi:hypothetical protein